jgi:hypothetical protein
MGYCSGYPVPGFMNVGPWFGPGFGGGFGRGLGFGRGRGWRRGGFFPFWASPYPWMMPYGYPSYASPWSFTEEEEKTGLEGQANILEDQLAQVKKRLEELKKKKKEAK